MIKNKALHELPSGKLPPEALESSVLSFCGFKRPEVLVGPRVGEDAAVIKLKEDEYLIVTTDPIVGATKGAGRLLVTVNSNDVAAKGGEPYYLATTMIFPKHTTKESIQELAKEIHEACKEINVAVVTGHTEVNTRYSSPVICGTMIGKANKLFSADQIRPTDVILMSKHVGLEGMSILASDRPDLLSRFLSPSEIEEVKGWVSETSVLREARIFRKYAKFMHDPTEGGVLGGLSELMELAGLGIELFRESLPIHPVTRKLSELLEFDPLHLISSGVLIAVVSAKDAEAVLEDFSCAGIDCAVVGRFVEGKGNIEVDYTEELWRLMEVK